MSYVFRMRYQRSQARTLYYYFCMMGGFYSTEAVTPVARRSWWIMNGLTLFYGLVIGPIGYLLTDSQPQLIDVLNMLVYTIGYAYAGIYTPLLTYYFRNELKTVIESIDSEFDCHRPEARVTDVQRRRYDSVTLVRRWLVWILSLIVLLSFVRPTYVILACDSSCLRRQRFYIEATPFTEHMRSLWLYLAISAMQVVYHMYAASLPSCNALFCLMTGYEFHNVCVNLMVRLDHAINDAVSNLRQTRTSSSERMPQNANNDSVAFEQFRQEIAAIVDRYQRLCRAIEMLRIWIEICVTVNVITFFGICTPFAYFVLNSAFEPLLRFQGAVGFVTMGTTTYTICLLGKVFDDVSEMLINEVYATKWYELPPRYRQMVHILHGQIQKAIQFRACLVYPVTMVTFARALRFIYSIINILRRPQL